MTILTSNETRVKRDPTSFRLTPAPHPSPMTTILFIYADGAEQDTGAHCTSEEMARGVMRRVMPQCPEQVRSGSGVVVATIRPVEMGGRL